MLTMRARKCAASTAYQSASIVIAATPPLIALRYTDKMVASGARSFRLTKWYMDCISPDGAFAVAYWARLHWGPLSLCYAGLMRSSSLVQPVVSRSTLRGGAGPIASATGVEWRCKGLGVHAAWRALCPSVERELYCTPAGAVRWKCIVPRGSCSLRVGDDTCVGLGYVEVLEMTLAPWDLPIAQLRWGRWIGAEGGITWIRWDGGHPLSLVLCDDTEVEATVSDDCIAFADGRRLELAVARVVREGMLGSTVLRSLPGVRLVAPKALLQTCEHKWLSKGQLIGDMASTPRQEAWAIHERVDFGGGG